MLIDCGHNDETHFYAADYLLATNCSAIERFFVLNYDEDHLSGLPRLRQMENRIPIRILNRNTSITGAQLRALKRQTGPLGPGMVFTIEPGIYIPEEKFGVRIEDMFYVESDGKLVRMTAGLARTADEVERAMAGK